MRKGMKKLTRHYTPNSQAVQREQLVEIKEMGLIIVITSLILPAKRQDRCDEHTADPEDRNGGGPPFHLHLDLGVGHQGIERLEQVPHWRIPPLIYFQEYSITK